MSIHDNSVGSCDLLKNQSYVHCEVNSLMESAQVVDSDGMTYCMYILLLLVSVFHTLTLLKLLSIN